MYLITYSITVRRRYRYRTSVLYFKGHGEGLGITTDDVSLAYVFPDSKRACSFIRIANELALSGHLPKPHIKKLKYCSSLTLQK